MTRSSLIVIFALIGSWQLVNSVAVNIVMKNHDKREDDPTGAKRIDKHQRIATWLKPKRPDWMSQEEYEALPEKVEIRLVDIVVEKAGFRSKKYTIATTILETETYSHQWLSQVYRSRWLVELDIQSIKCSLGLDVVRAKTPDMIKTEIWSCLLAYNLIRMKMLQSASLKKTDAPHPQLHNHHANTRYQLALDQHYPDARTDRSRLASSHQ